MNSTEKNAVFEDVFKTGSYGATGECHCGIFHCDISDSWDDEHNDSVIPSIEESAKSDPQRYQLHDSAIEYLDLNGRLYVIGCRCQMDRFIFEFLTEEKQNVLSFYLNTQDKLNASDICQGNRT